MLDNNGNILPLKGFKMEIIYKTAVLQKLCSVQPLEFNKEVTNILHEKYVSFFYIIIINFIFLLDLSCSRPLLICGNKIALEFLCPDSVLYLNVLCC